MKLTASQLKKIIKEEVSSVLSEGNDKFMGSITLEMKMGTCGKAGCPNAGRQALVVEYYKGDRLTRSRCRTCDPRGWARAADLMAFQGGGVHD